MKILLANFTKMINDSGANVVLVGGSAQDFEIPEMLMEEFTDYRIVCGRGNIRGIEGPRNAVATGLVLSYLGEKR